jgi:hypothetical protein
MTQDLRAGRRVPGWQWAALPPAAAAATAATSGAYLLWLGWHQLEDKSAYEPWQVVGLAMTAGAVVIAATWRSTPLGLLTAAVVTVSLTTVWCWDAATTYSENPSFWPVGGVFLLVGATVGRPSWALSPAQRGWSPSSSRPPAPAFRRRPGPALDRHRGRRWLTPTLLPVAALEIHREGCREVSIPG